MMDKFDLHYSQLCIDATLDRVGYETFDSYKAFRFELIIKLYQLP